jgi:hypothetical protein
MVSAPLCLIIHHILSETAGEARNQQMVGQKARRSWVMHHVGELTLVGAQIREQYIVLYSHKCMIVCIRIFVSVELISICCFFFL